MNLDKLTGKSFTEGSYQESVDSPIRIRKDFLKTEEKRLPGKLEMAVNLTKSLSKTAKSFVSGGDISAEVSLRKKGLQFLESSYKFKGFGFGYIFYR